MTKRERPDSHDWLLVIALDNHGVILTCMKRPVTEAGEESDPESFRDFYGDEDGTTWKPGWEPIEERDIAAFTASHHCRVVILRTD